MVLKIVTGLAVALVAFLAYVSTRPGHFRYERSGLINAPAERIFPYLSQFKLGSQWSPYEEKDPGMKKTITGTDGQAGAAMEFEGKPEAGSGRIELVSLVPNESVELRLLMTKPMATDNKIEYRLAREGSATRFTWSMSGEGGFLGKLVSVFIDCEKMVAGDFEKGIRNLKALVESSPVPVPKASP